MHTPHRCTAIAVLLGLALPSAAWAQGEPPPDATHLGRGGSSVTRGKGLAVDDRGELLGIAHHYKAAFRPDHFEYTPVLGARAPHDMTWRYTLTAVGRGTDFGAIAAPSRTHGDLQVRYARGPVTEVYDVRSDGVEQSFVLTSLPPGRGDLVVRGRVDTELVLAAATPLELTFLLEGVGGVRVGSVVAIDAAGRRVTGELRCDGTTLDYVLPAAFVDQAALPLVVDPLVGSVVTLGGANDDLDPDVAWDATTATWLAVWSRQLSGANNDIRGQRLDLNGALVGGQINLETDTTTTARTPRVANVNQRDGFVVVWQTSGDILARGVDSATAGLTPIVTVASGTPFYVNPDVGGEAVEAAGDEAFCVYHESTTPAIRLRPITFNANSTLSVGAQTTVATGSSDSNPSIAQSGGASGFWLVVWVRDVGNQDIMGRIWNRTAGFVTSAFAIENSATDCLVPACDGDGYNWVVAYSRRESTGSDVDLVASSVLMHPSGVTVNAAVVVDADQGESEADPSVAWVGNSALVAYSDEVVSPNYDMYVRSVDPFGCTSCEGTFLLDSSALNDGFSAIGSRFSGGSFTSGEAAIAWMSFDSTALVGDIDWQRFSATDGSATDLGGGCGNGGLAYATCSRSPNANFRLRQRRAAPNATTFCVLGFNSLNYACGPCELVPDPFTGLITTTTTNGNGDATLSLPIPSGVASNSITLQWLVAGSNCFSGFDLSNAVRVTLQ